MYTSNPSLGGGTPEVKMYGGCYAMYTSNPSLGGGTPMKKESSIDWVNIGILNQ